MASGGSGVPPTDPTDTPSPQAGVPADSQSGKDTRKAKEESAERCKDGAKVCQFFRIGKCHFGLRCRLAHSDPLQDDSGALCPGVDEKQEEEKTQEKHKNKKGSVNKVPKHNERREVNKKPRMRTADEVISRILWDPSVDASEFVVGYVDRFLGVLERPFCDFNWETNPCDCDYTVELALPRHRIQYFTYRGHRVWDRHTRTDRVFGSTGQSLAPPFGGEEEVREENTAALETTNEQPPAEEEKQNETNIHTPESAPPPPECTGNTSQEQQESRGPCVEEEAADRSGVRVARLNITQNRS